MARSEFSRRLVVRAALAGAIVPLGRGAWAATAEAGPGRSGSGGPKRLIVILLRGAVDGLNVVVPYAEAAYYEARPTIAIARPTEPGGALALDGHFGLHPALAALLPLWRERGLAFVHAAGSPDPNRSHFEAQRYIENGTPGCSTTADGWMNRLLQALPGRRGPTDAIMVGPTLPRILFGAAPVANLPLGPGDARPMPIDRPQLAGAFDRLYAADDALGAAYREGRSARARAARRSGARASHCRCRRAAAGELCRPGGAARPPDRRRRAHPARLRRSRRLGHPCRSGRRQGPARRPAAPARRRPRRCWRAGSAPPGATRWSSSSPNSAAPCTRTAIAAPITATAM